MPKEDTQFNSETASEAGKKSKRKPLDEILHELAQEIEQKKGIPKGQAINEALLKRASKGDVKAIELYYKRTYGEVPKNLQLSGNLTNYIVDKKDLPALTEQMKKEDDL